MVKKGQIDNGEAFLRLFPKSKDQEIHFMDVKLRKKYQDLKRSFIFEYLSTDIKTELHKGIMSIKSYKSGLLRNEYRLGTYECAVHRFHKNLLEVDKFIKEGLNPKNEIGINDLENVLINLDLGSLRKIIANVINKTGIILNEVNTRD